MSNQPRLETLLRAAYDLLSQLQDINAFSVEYDDADWSGADLLEDIGEELKII
jgi:hypothetical protein